MPPIPGASIGVRDGVSGELRRAVKLRGRNRAAPRRVGTHGLNSPEPGIEGESEGVFDASGAAETVVDVIGLRAAAVVTPPVGFGISRTNGRTQHVARQVRGRKHQQQDHRHEGEARVLLAEHVDFHCTPGFDERQTAGAKREPAAYPRTFRRVRSIESGQRPVGCSWVMFHFTSAASTPSTTPWPLCGPKPAYTMPLAR
jgi:hypothetical protein